MYLDLFSMKTFTTDFSEAIISPSAKKTYQKAKIEFSNILANANFGAEFFIFTVNDSVS